jgi:hypothetical protein
MQTVNVLNVLVWLIGGGVSFALAAAGVPAWGVAATGFLSFILGLSPQVAQQWQRAIVLRLGRFKKASGPGVFFIMPFFDRVAQWVDQRIITTPFTAEQTLTRDTVPVNVDSVLFWHVHDSEKAALEVQDYRNAVTWAAQTALRELIGRTSLADMLTGRDKMEKSLQEIIDQRVNPWGATVQTVEMRDVVIPADLQDAMSREAQAEREKNARVILGQAEVMIAKQFDEASKCYQGNPVALHLRAMNMLYEGLKEKGALMVVPSSAVETMGLGALSGLAALRSNAMTAGISPTSDVKPQ